jgi:hypothetical protein
MYSNSGRICQIDNDVGGVVPDYTNAGYDTGTLITVPFGSGGWVHLSFSFTVARSYQADGFGGPYSVGTVVVPTAFVAWFDIVTTNPTAETANMWIYGTQLYITP